MKFLKVPGYDVLSFIINESFDTNFAISIAAASKYFSSGFLLLFNGVGTAIIIASAPSNNDEARSSQ